MCAIPESIDNGGYQVVPEDGIDVSSGLVRSGARAVYYCDSGYRVSPRDITAITCVDGTWSHSAPLCQRRTPAEYCAAVPVVEHAHHYEVSGSVGADGTVSSGTKVIYVCDTGYHQQGSSAATCMDGEWNGSGPTCVMDVSCTESPPEVAHSEFGIYRRDGVNSLLDAVTGGAPNGAYAYYYCHTGYRMTNTNSTALVCTDGEWKGTVPTCGMSFALLIIFFCIILCSYCYSSKSFCFIFLSPYTHHTFHRQHFHCPLLLLFSYFRLNFSTSRFHHRLLS